MKGLKWVVPVVLILLAAYMVHEHYGSPGWVVFGAILLIVILAEIE